VVDDVQWLDQASARALGFAARRLQADAVAVLLAGREPGEVADAAGLAEVRLAGLADADARALLASVLPPWADQKVIDRIVAETAGNPLALLELPRGMTPAELADGPGLGGTAGLPGRIEDSFRRRLELLPEPTRRLVLLAAADPAGDAALLWRACALAGIDPGAAGPAEDAGLVQVGTWVRFFHPLVRSAVFRAASAQERRAAHGVLAAATDAAAYPDRRAWHRAQEFGIWGGWDENERRLLHGQWRARRRRPGPARLPPGAWKVVLRKPAVTWRSDNAGLVALMHDRGSDHSCPDVLPTLSTSDICRCWCPSGCEVQKTASRSPRTALSWRLSVSSRSRRRWQMSLRRTSPGTTAGGPRSVFADPWSTMA
jgi:hypothetical protein